MFHLRDSVVKKLIIQSKMSQKGTQEMTLENVKKFWDARPCNIKHSNAEIGSKEYFE
jgi:hypothetical protein